MAVILYSENNEPNFNAKNPGGCSLGDIRQKDTPFRKEVHYMGVRDGGIASCIRGFVRPKVVSTRAEESFNNYSDQIDSAGY